MLKIGLTGSIGTGKSFIANLFREKSYLVIDSDACVNEIYQTDIVFFKFIQQHFPSVIKDKIINRKKLGDIVFSDKSKLQLLESYLHPKLKIMRDHIVEAHQKELLIVFDIPLLYEKNIDAEMDIVIVTDCAVEIQKQRVLTRDDMDEVKFLNIIKTQLPYYLNQQL